MSSIWFSLVNSEEKDLKEIPFHPDEKHPQLLFGKPIEIGCFSIDDERIIHFDRSQMKYLVLPLEYYNLHMDLNVNFDLDVQLDFKRLEKMHQTLYWLLYTNENSSNMQFSKTNVDFITVRGTLKLLSCTSYLKGSYHSEWEICASKFEGVIYFSAIDSDADIEENKNITKRQALLRAWGFKFEQYITADTIDGKCNIESKTSQLKEYIIVLKNVIENYGLLYTAEIDAAIAHKYPGPGSGNTACYTELKTSRLITNETQKYYFHRYKSVTWWAQSFFTGIPEIVCGLRDDDGIVKKLEFMSVCKLPEKSWGMWSPEACLNFCVKFLNFLKKTVMEDDPNVVYKFSYKGEETIYCSKMVNPDPRYRVIPEWFVKNKNSRKI